MYGVQGTPDCYRIELKNVYGVQENLISYRQASLGAWVAIAGGGDPYEVAYAIYKAVPDISVLTNDVVNPSGAAVDKNDTDHCVSGYVSRAVCSAIITKRYAFNHTEYSLNQLYRSTGIEKAVQQSIADYINGIATGEPINIFLIRDIFLNQVKGLVSSNLVSMIDIQVGINGKLSHLQPTPARFMVILTPIFPLHLHKFRLSNMAALLESIIPAYPYTQYNDDPDIVAFLMLITNWHRGILITLTT